MKTDERIEAAVAYLERNYLGPNDGDIEVIQSRPDATYLVGVLYPRELSPGIFVPLESETELGDNEAPDIDEGGVIESASEWRPSSAAISFIHDGAQVSCTLGFATYSEVDTEKPSKWARRPEELITVVLGHDEKQIFRTERYNVSISSRWRRVGQAWLVTVGVTNQTPNSQSPEKPPTEDSMYQVALDVESVGGKIRPYNTVDSLALDHEEEELALRYRKSAAFAVGHGMSVSWELGDDKVETFAKRVSLAPLPRYTVPAVDPVGSTSPAMRLGFLSTLLDNPSSVLSEISAFVDEYAGWVRLEGQKANSFTGRNVQPATRIVSRAEVARDRMKAGIELLRASELARESFSLAMTAMREQMLQVQRTRPGATVELEEPLWRPFQLGFILLCLPSQMDEKHADRDLVDLIWFPTGGGKTEAYLGLAAIEIFARRLRWGVDGGGTAVITRYTLRLLTTQQFQRAATLICSMEIMRSNHPRVKGMQPFSIGLWVGNETTPGTYKEAATRLAATHKKSEPDNPFQLTHCPWCRTPIMPTKRKDNLREYGAFATTTGMILRCPSDDCVFTEELPVQVVDEALYDSPPTILLGTVDKFARLPFEAKAARLLGRGLSFHGPTLIIQDELHLLSGPLGTTVALYEAAIQGLLRSGGESPKIVASTATIRAAEQQVAQLFDSEVALYPPSGIDEEDSFFARQSTDKPGRTFVGVMPQAYSHSTSVVRSLTPMLELPQELERLKIGQKDDYWTVVAYHNSLRELGRTVTLVRDDVDSALRARGRGSFQTRTIHGDSLIELTSNIQADDLPKQLARLEMALETGGAIDFVASTNMLSVGIDVSRLAIMLMNGQPKTTSEYIQATSRVGRGSVPGLVVTLFRATRPRDRSHYEVFNSFHQSLYRSVEPTSVTPWSESSRRRSLAGVLVAYIRHVSSWSGGDDAGRFDPQSILVRQVIDSLSNRVQRLDPEEAESFTLQLNTLVAEWSNWASQSRNSGEPLFYHNDKRPSLTKQFGVKRVGWPVSSSMRAVDRNVRVIAKGEER
jgi:hypothetical protein